MKSLKTVCVIPALLLMACCGHAADEGAGARETPPAIVAASEGRDLFADLRTTSRLAGSAYWHEVGRALRRLETLESATWSPETGTLLLSGKPAKTTGPYHIDDLIVILRGVLFDKQTLGMSIDPVDPEGKKLVVRYDGGCGDTAVGWLLFECDRLLKCYSQGADNLTQKEFGPQNIPDFVSMIDREAAQPRSGAPKERSTRFWLTPNLKKQDGKSAGKPAAKSDGFQPIARVSEDKHTIYLEHVRIYVRSQPTHWQGGKMVDSPGAKDVQAEQFGIHFSNHYDEFAREQPVFARLKDLARLQMLAEWIQEQNIPVDFEFIRNYRPQTPVKTPRTTPAIEVRRERVEQQGNSIVKGTTRSVGGVDFATKTFFAVDNGTAKRIGQTVRDGQKIHPADCSWRQPIDGQEKLVVVMPTLKTQVVLPPSYGKAGFIQPRRPKGEQEGPDAALPLFQAQADRSRPAPERDVTPLEMTSLNEFDSRGDADETALPAPRISTTLVAGVDRSTGIGRTVDPLRPLVDSASARGPPELTLFHKLPESGAGADRADSLPARLTDRLPLADPSSGPKDSTTATGNSPAKLQPGADRSTTPPRLEDPLIEKPTGKPDSARGPPRLEAGADRASSAPPRDTTPVVSQSGASKPDARSEVRQQPTGKTLPSTTLNLPHLVSRRQPNHTSEQWIDGVPDSKLIVPDQLAIVSELGDISIQFQKPQIDQRRRALFFPTDPPGRNGISGYYPKTSTLEFADGRRIAFGENGFPAEVTLANASRVRFEYATEADAADAKAVVPVAFELSDPQSGKAPERFALVTTADRREQALSNRKAVAPLPLLPPELPPAEPPPPIPPSGPPPAGSPGSKASPGALAAASTGTGTAPLVPATVPAKPAPSLVSAPTDATKPVEKIDVPQPARPKSPAGAGGELTLAPAAPLLDETAEIRFEAGPSPVGEGLKVQVVRPSQKIDEFKLQPLAGGAGDSSAGSPLSASYQFHEGGQYSLRVVDAKGTTLLSRDIQVCFKAVPDVGRPLELKWGGIAASASGSEFKEVIQLLTSTHACQWSARLRCDSDQHNPAATAVTANSSAPIVVMSPDGSARQLQLAESAGSLPARAVQRLMVHAVPVAPGTPSTAAPLFVDVTLTWNGDQGSETRTLSTPLRLIDGGVTTQRAGRGGGLGGAAFFFVGAVVVGGLITFWMKGGQGTR